MSRYRIPTASNQYAGVDLQRRFLRQLREEYIDALAPLQELAQRSNISPAEAVEALHQLRAATAEIERLQFAALGAAVLAGATITDIAARTGISRRTLTRHLASTAARLRGREIVPDPTSPHGWRSRT